MKLLKKLFGKRQPENKPLPPVKKIMPEREPIITGFTHPLTGKAIIIPKEVNSDERLVKYLVVYLDLSPVSKEVMSIMEMMKPRATGFKHPETFQDITIPKWLNSPNEIFDYLTMQLKLYEYPYRGEVIAKRIMRIVQQSSEFPFEFEFKHPKTGESIIIPRNTLYDLDTLGYSEKLSKYLLTQYSLDYQTIKKIKCKAHFYLICDFKNR
jgi:hypothetical protein